MTKGIKTKGGAIVGFLQAKTPLAILSVDQNLLRLNSNILGEYTFSNSEIVSIDKVRFLFSTGIKITHNKKKYPNRIIFFSSESDTDTLLKNIIGIGFSPTGEATEKNPIISLNVPNILLVVLLVFLSFWFLLFYFF